MCQLSCSRTDNFLGLGQEEIEDIPWDLPTPALPMSVDISARGNHSDNWMLVYTLYIVA